MFDRCVRCLTGDADVAHAETCPLRRDRCGFCGDRSHDYDDCPERQAAAAEAGNQPAAALELDPTIPTDGDADSDA